MHAHRLSTRGRSTFGGAAGLRSAPTLPLALLILGVFALAGSGCTRQSRIASHLSKADAYFAAGDYPKAELEYANALQLDPNNPQAISRMGIIFFDEGRTALALSFLPKARQLAPHDLDVRQRLAVLDGAAGKLQEAREEAFYVLEHRPQDEEVPFVLAQTATQPKEVDEIRARLKKLPTGAPVLVTLGLFDLRQRKFKEAKERFLQAQKLAPKSGAVDVALGMLYDVQKDLPQAGKAFARAAERAPVRSSWQLRYARFLLQTGKTAEAKQFLQKLTQKAPDFVSAWSMLAAIAGNEKKYDEALADLDKVLAVDPANHDALLTQARMTFAKGDKDKAIAELQRMEQLFPKSPAPPLQLGTYQWSMGNAEQAAASLKQALTLAPDLPSAVLLLAEINIRRGRAALAVDSLKDLVKKHPDLGSARLMLAQAYRAQGNLDAALAIYRHLDASFKANPQPSYLTGLILERQNKLAEARAAFNKSLAIDPGFGPAIEQLVSVDLVEKKFDAAKQRVEAVIAKDPKNANLQILMARIHLVTGKTAQGEADLKKAIALAPDDPLPYDLLGQLYLRSNQQAKALEQLEKAVLKNPKDVQALILIASIQDQQKDFVHAREAYEKVVALDPNSAVALNNLAYLYSSKFNDLDKGLDMAQKARQLLPHNPNIADTLGWIAFQKGRYPWALSLLTESADKLPSSAEIHYHLGMAYYMLGRETPAKAALQQALKLSPDFDGAAEAKRALAVLAIDPRAGGAGALAALEKTVAAHPDDPVAQVRLGEAYRLRGKTDRADQAFEAALKASPDNVVAALHVIQVDIDRHNVAKALDLAKATHQLAPNNPEVTHVLGRLAFQTADYPWALSLLQECAPQLPHNADVQYDLAMAAYSNGDVTTAQQALHDALQANPHFPRAAQARGMSSMIALAAGPAQAAAAMGTIEERLRQAPGDVPALMALAAAQEYKSDAASAERSYDKVLSRYPGFSPAKRQLTLLYAKSRHLGSKAVEIATQARAAFPDDPVVAKAAGIINFRQGNYDRALPLLQDGARRLPADAEVMYYLGMAQYHLKNSGESVRSLERALQLGLSPDLAGEAKRILAAKGKS